MSDCDLRRLRQPTPHMLALLLGLLCLCLLVSTITVSAQLHLCEQHEDTGTSKGDLPDTQKNYYRLPWQVRPVNYRLALRPNFSKKTFDGKVIITIKILKPTKVITLHSNKLEIHSVMLRLNNIVPSVPIVSTNLTNDKREMLNINLKTELLVSYYDLEIAFSGKLDGLVGFYASTLKNSKTMVASKFQPTYARQAFPCFDEPDFKATFDITLTKPISYVALSNMNEVSRVTDEGSNTESVTFARSVPMSTYLACFVVCDFEFKETEIQSQGIGKNFILRSFAQKGQTNKIDFAQHIGKRVTEFYVQYYEVPFPLPKLDMIAIPDYVSGATEHWGLVTYRETSFLVDSAVASARNKVSVANTIAHELAHMWFGNLVTMKWWDEVWLNEGFASYMQVKALNAIEPSWTMLDQFLTKTLHSVLVTDAKLSSHPIVQPVDTPDQITAIFDAISYNKGSSILRMLEGFVGEEGFRRGVSDYLKKHQFGNTVTQDLLSCLDPYFKADNPDLDLKYIMDTWTRQMGYPLLTVTKGKGTNTYVITQTRFLLDPNDSEFDYRWFVPITYKTNKGSSSQILWFPDKVQEVTLKLDEGESWLKINNNQVGYYRVNYPLDEWRDLMQALKAQNSQLSISDRSNLLSDVFALAEASHVSYSLALDLTTYLTKEADYVPWDTAAGIFSTLATKLRNTPAYDDLMLYVQKLISPVYETMSWERQPNTSIIHGLLRSKVLGVAAWCGLPDAQTRVSALLRDWLRDAGHTGLEPDLRDFVYYEGMKSAGQEQWDALWQIYLREDDAQEQAKLRTALAAPRNADILTRYIELSWDENNVRSQDFLGVVQAVARNPAGEAAAWAYVRAQWPALAQRYSLNSRYLGALLPAVCAAFNTDQQLKEMEDFFAQYPEAGAGATMRVRALESVRHNVRWHREHLPALQDWLRAANQ